MMHTYDVIVIGSGFLGLSTTYQLSKMGMRILLLEAGDISSGTSASCSGRVQVIKGHLDPLHIKLIQEGLKKHETLEEELGVTFDRRRIGLFLLIKNEHLLNQWKERAQSLP